MESGAYGVCIKYLSFKKWPEVKGGEFGSPLIPTPDMMRRQSLSYWGMTEVPPSEKVVAKAKPLDATELVDRIVANRTRRDEALRVRREKKKAKTTTAKIFEREKSGRGFKYLVSLYVFCLFYLLLTFVVTILILNGSIGLEFQKNFFTLVEEFDRTWDKAHVLAKTKQNDEEYYYYDGEEYNDEDASYDDKNDYFSDDEFLED